MLAESKPNPLDAGGGGGGLWWSWQEDALHSGHFLSPVGTEWVDPEDPTVIAENELLGAAAAIEAAAKKLEQLKPRAKPKVGRSAASH